MAKFKQHQKVKCINDEDIKFGELSYGHDYTVARAFEDGHVWLMGIGGIFREDRFREVNEEPLIKGGKVICIGNDDNRSDLEVGCTYTITGVAAGGYVSVHNGGRYFCPSQFKPIEKEEYSKLKVGDTVMCVSIPDGSSLKKDCIYTVEYVISSPDKGFVKLVCNDGEWYMDRFKKVEDAGIVLNDTGVTLRDTLSEQVGGTHYNGRSIQPIEFIMANNLGFCEGNVVKYITRHADKNGAEDIKKVIQYCKFILADKYGEKV